MKCYSCGNTMENGVEPIIFNGKTIHQKILKCNKCHKSIVSSEEYEKVRRELHPSLMTKIKNIFNGNAEFVVKGKVL